MIYATGIFFYNKNNSFCKVFNPGGCSPLIRNYFYMLTLFQAFFYPGNNILSCTVNCVTVNQACAYDRPRKFGGLHHCLSLHFCKTIPAYGFEFILFLIVAAFSIK